jgi:hypothetical protein
MPVSELMCRCGHAAIEHMDDPWHVGVCFRRHEMVAHPCACEGWIEDETLTAIMAI